MRNNEVKENEIDNLFIQLAADCVNKGYTVGIAATTVREAREVLQRLKEVIPEEWLKDARSNRKDGLDLIQGTIRVTSINGESFRGYGTNRIFLYDINHFFTTKNAFLKMLEFRDSMIPSLASRADGELYTYYGPKDKFRTLHSV